MNLHMLGAADLETSGGAVVSVTVDPKAPTVEMGSTQKFTAIAMDAAGKAFTPPVVSWAAVGCGAIDAGGVFTPTGPGTCTVLAQVGKIRGRADVTVVDPETDLDPDEDVDVDWAAEAVDDVVYPRQGLSSFHGTMQEVDVQPDTRLAIRRHYPDLAEIEGRPFEGGRAGANRWAGLEGDAATLDEIDEVGDEIGLEGALPGAAFFPAGGGTAPPSGGGGGGVISPGGFHHHDDWGGGWGGPWNWGSDWGPYFYERNLLARDPIEIDDWDLVGHGGGHGGGHHGGHHGGWGWGPGWGWGGPWYDVGPYEVPYEVINEGIDADAIADLVAKKMLFASEGVDADMLGDIMDTKSEYDRGEQLVLLMNQTFTALGRPKEFEAQAEGIWKEYQDAKAGFWWTATEKFMNATKMKNAGIDAAKLTEDMKAAYPGKMAAANTSNIPSPSTSFLGRFAFPTWGYWLIGAGAVGIAGWFLGPIVIAMIAKRSGRALSLARA